MNGSWFAPQHRLLNGFLYFLSWKGELGRFFVSWGKYYHDGEGGFIGLEGGGGGGLPLHLPWINPSARQLYAMTIIICACLLHYLYGMTDMHARLL